MKDVEYRIVPVTRYLVTRFERAGNSAGSEGLGEFDNERTAYRVARALYAEDAGQIGVNAVFKEAEHKQRLEAEEEKFRQLMEGISG